MGANEKNFDVVLWGATGFTGSLVAEYLTQRYGTGDKGLRCALAGRNNAKLKSLRQQLCKIDPKAFKGRNIRKLIPKWINFQEIDLNL